MIILHLSAIVELIMLILLVDRSWILNEKVKISSCFNTDYLTIDINNECRSVPNTNFCDEMTLQANHIDVYRPHERRWSASGIYIFALS